MNQIPYNIRRAIIRFVRNNPNKYGPAQVAGKFKVSITTLYRIGEKLKLPFKTYQTKEPETGEFFSWKNYADGVI